MHVIYAHGPNPPDLGATTGSYLRLRKIEINFGLLHNQPIHIQNAHKIAAVDKTNFRSSTISEEESHSVEQRFLNSSNGLLWSQDSTDDQEVNVQ